MFPKLTRKAADQICEANFLQIGLILYYFDFSQLS